MTDDRTRPPIVHHQQHVVVDTANRSTTRARIPSRPRSPHPHEISERWIQAEHGDAPAWVSSPSQRRWNDQQANQRPPEDVLIAF
jgi:hypothetical protein